MTQNQTQPGQLTPFPVAQVIAEYTRNGWVVLTVGESWVTFRTKKPTNHLLHLILTFCTFGLWWPVWGILAWWNREKTRTFSVRDGYAWIPEDDYK